MKKKVGVVTATRAEYGLLKNVMHAINDSKDLELVLFVTGTHLLSEYGSTIDSIIDDGFAINEKIDILMRNDNPAAISKTMGIAAMSFGDAFERNPIDMLVVLGDRYELLPICQAAMCHRIPIAHISGGEATEGLIDEAVRHCVTKMSYLQLPSCEEYKKRIIQLGENPNRVFNFGDVGVENIKTVHLMEKNELEKSINVMLHKPYFCVTFHPVTLENCTAELQIDELLNVVECLNEYDFIITKSNADSGNQIINKKIDEFVAKHNNSYCFESLGLVRYLSLLKYSCGVIGNSSSGIIEAPLFGIPTINIGDRQKGRIKASSIIDCQPSQSDITESIRLAVSNSFIQNNCDGSSPFSCDNTAVNIVDKIREFIVDDNIDLKKSFYDVDFNYEGEE